MAIGPICRWNLNLLCRFQRFESMAVGNWIFVGPASFLKTVGEAADYLKSEEPDFVRGLPVKYRIIYCPSHLLAFSLWRYGGIPDSYLEWGMQGLTAAWIFIYYNHACMDKSRWLMAIGENSLSANREAYVKTRQWLEARRFPDGLCEPFRKYGQQSDQNSETDEGSINGRSGLPRRSNS